MVQPIDYNLNVLSPMQRFTEGLKFGEDLLTARLARDETQQLMGMRAAQEARAVAAAEEQRAAAEAERAKAAEFQTDLAGLVKLANGGLLTADAINAVGLKHAKTLDEALGFFTSMEKERQKPLADFGRKVATLSMTGNAAAAEALYQERIEAAKNTGTPEAMQEAQALEADLAALKADPINFGTMELLSLRRVGVIDDKELETLLDMAKQGQPGTSDVQSSLPGRIATVIVRKDGTVEIRDNRTNEIVTGAAAEQLMQDDKQLMADVKNAVEQAGATGRLEAQIDLGALASAAEAGGQASIKLAEASSAAVAAARSNIGTLDRAIELVEQEGANTGVIARTLPSWNASTVELNNLQGQLTIDVIGAVTFGALSEGELALAMDIALPTGLDEKELADWLRRKKTAQQKLANYHSKKARFFSDGFSIGQWEEFIESGETDMRAWMDRNVPGPRRRTTAPAPTNAAPTGEGLSAEDLQYLEGN